MAVVDDEFEVVEIERAPEAVDVEAEADASAAAETADAPEDAAVPGVDDPPLDDVVAEDE